MIRLATLAAALLLATAAARAQGAPSPEMLAATLQAVTAQRNQALNQNAVAAAQLGLAQQEVARLKEALERATPPSAPTPAEPPK